MGELSRKKAAFASVAGAMIVLVIVAAIYLSPADQPASPQMEAKQREQQEQMTVGSMGAAWMGPDKRELPLKDHEEVAEFLRTATVVESERTKDGVNRPLKVTLEKDGIRLNAVFRDVSIYKRKIQLGHETKVDFRDEARYEVAAYELSRMLGMENVPPAVERRINGKNGTLQLWIENSMTEKSRLKKGVEPGNKVRWIYERQLMYVFDNLIYNEDRNQGNMLYDADWKMWFIDHTRAFRRWNQLSAPNLVRRCERDFFEALKSLDEDEVRERLKSCLKKNEIKGLLQRRDALVQHIQGLIDTRGEKVVLYDLASAPPAVS